jgi:hypothetical protein
MGLRNAVVVIVLVGTAVVVWQLVTPDESASSGAGQTVALEMEAYGGFAYIRQADTLNIAYLRSTDRRSTDGCFVEQLGTDLFVVSGIIDTPAASATRTFDVGGAVVTFPALASGSLNTNRAARPNGRPGRWKDEDAWHNLQWVAGISSGAQGTDYPNAQLRSDWPQIVDGRVEIRRGEVRASHPSDIAVQAALFDFKRADAGESEESTKFTQAMTDRTIWKVDVPGNHVEILITGGRGSVNKLVVRPSKPNRPVKLRLIGRHSHGVAPALAEGDELTHFCAFYDLMPDASRPDKLAQLKPFIKELPTYTDGTGYGQPSPGAYCPGDWP